MESREPLQPCFILHRRDLGETSLLLEMFGSAQGRVPVVAKGARRGRAPAAAFLQPFQPLWASWSGRGEVFTLTCGEPAGRPAGLSGRALWCGFYLNELLMRLLGRGDPCEELFAFYHATLETLADDGQLETRLRQFELRLLGELGYAPPLDREAGSGQSIRPERRYDCPPGSRPRLLPDARDGSGIAGATLLQLVRGEPLTGAAAREARTLLRGLLAPHLGPRPLYSRELFRRRPRSAASPSPAQMP